MTEKIFVNGKEVWVVVQPHPMERENPNIIPNQYFTATYHLQEPREGNGKLIMEDDREPCMFESPVAALEAASKKLASVV